MFLGNMHAMAAEPAPTAGPPAAYRLADLRLSITLDAGRSTQGPQHLTLPGSGLATMERAGKRKTFSYPATELLARVNELYAIHFFQLPTRYDAQVSVFLKADGTVATQLMHLSDAASTSVCFTLPTFEKCVTYGGTAPDKLDALVQRLLADADTRVR